MWTEGQIYACTTYLSFIFLCTTVIVVPLNSPLESLGAHGNVQYFLFWSLRTGTCPYVICSLSPPVLRTVRLATRRTLASTTVKDIQDSSRGPSIHLIQYYTVLHRTTQYYTVQYSHVRCIPRNMHIPVVCVPKSLTTKTPAQLSRNRDAVHKHIRSHIELLIFE